MHPWLKSVEIVQTRPPLEGALSMEDLVQSMLEYFALPAVGWMFLLRRQGWLSAIGPSGVLHRFESPGRVSPNLESLGGAEQNCSAIQNESWIKCAAMFKSHPGADIHARNENCGRGCCSTLTYWLCCCSARRLQVAISVN